MSKIDLSKQYKTRDGCEVKIFMVDGGGRFPVKGVIRRIDGYWSLMAWDFYGMNGTGPSGDDLIEVKPVRKLEMWVNVYTPPYSSVPCSSKEEAEKCEGNGRIACVHIVQEYEEGEGLDT